MRAPRAGSQQRWGRPALPRTLAVVSASRPERTAAGLGGDGVQQGAALGGGHALRARAVQLPHHVHDAALPHLHSATQHLAISHLSAMQSPRLIFWLHAW